MAIQRIIENSHLSPYPIAVPHRVLPQGASVALIVCEEMEQAAGAFIRDNSEFGIIRVLTPEILKKEFKTSQ